MTPGATQAPGILAQRTMVVAEARRWLGTPYRHAARVLGAGVDCGQLLAAVYEATGVVPRGVEIAPYPADWMLHRSEQRFRGLVEQHLRRRVESPGPGDVALFQWGRSLSHGAIVVGWPLIVHAYLPERQVVISDLSTDTELAERYREAWSPWEG